MSFWMGLLVGVFLGCGLGIFVAALLAAGARASEWGAGGE